MANRTRLLATVLVTTALTIAQPARAAAPQCSTYGSGGYCQYDGTVRQVYMNAYNQILLYFDTPLNIPNATAVGITGVTNPNAGIYTMTTNADFGNALFAALLAAQARGAQVRVHIPSASSGYLVIDRIWVNE